MIARCALGDPVAARAKPMDHAVDGGDHLHLGGVRQAGGVRGVGGQRTTRATSRVAGVTGGRFYFTKFTDFTEFSPPYSIRKSYSCLANLYGIPLYCYFALARFVSKTRETK